MGFLSSLIGLVNSRVANLMEPPRLPKEPDALRIGILGAAAIAPNALINPSASHPGVVVQAVAARDETRAREFARKHGIPTVFSSYQEMLDSPLIDAVYNPLPNGLHYEWTIKALNAGKHVLLEKPSACRVEETRKMFQLAEAKNLVLLEAFHYQFHPANQRFKELATNGSLGTLRRIEVYMTLFDRFFAKNDIRFNYDLSGGASTDMGCYCISYARYLAGSEPTVAFARPQVLPDQPQIDRAMTADLHFQEAGEGGVLARIYCDLAEPWRFGVIPRMPNMHAKAICDNGEIEISNFPLPTLFHSITIRENGKAKRTEHAFKFADPKLPGEDWWSTYRFQLEAFVDKVRGRTPQHWFSPKDSVAQTKILEEVYAKAGLEQRPLSDYQP